MLVGAAVSGRAFSFRGGLLQSTYHVQFLAMTANLAVPGLSYSYRQLARFFRWWVRFPLWSGSILDQDAHTAFQDHEGDDHI
eukprot:1150748-Pelagomonas_calceolata.AAC.3